MGDKAELAPEIGLRIIEADIMFNFETVLHWTFNPEMSPSSSFYEPLVLCLFQSYPHSTVFDSRHAPSSSISFTSLPILYPQPPPSLSTYLSFPPFFSSPTTRSATDIPLKCINPFYATQNLTTFPPKKHVTYIEPLLAESVQSIDQDTPMARMTISSLYYKIAFLYGISQATVAFRVR